MDSPATPRNVDRRADDAGPTSSAQSGIGLGRRISVEAIPEYAAVASSESISEMSILVRLRVAPVSSLMRIPLDLVMVLDASEAMHGSKLDHVKDAVVFVINNMDPHTDRLSLVSFSDHAEMIVPLLKMIEFQRKDALHVLSSLVAQGSTNIVAGLKKGVEILEKRRHPSHVQSIILLSGGRDTCNSCQQIQEYLRLLPASIFPGEGFPRGTFPVHTIGIGSEHDPLALHAVSDASGGSYSFVDSCITVEDAVASCIGGLLSVAAQEVSIVVHTDTSSIKLKSISSGRYPCHCPESQFYGVVYIGYVYGDEVKEFLVGISISQEINRAKQSSLLLSVICSYKDITSGDELMTTSYRGELCRPEDRLPLQMELNTDVHRQKTRLYAAQSIAKAQQIAEKGDLSNAVDLISHSRWILLMMSSAAHKQDAMREWILAEMSETEERMLSRVVYEKVGRAYALSSMSSHGSQRATTRGAKVPGVAAWGDGDGTVGDSSYDPYVTPPMVRMVNKARRLRFLCRCRCK